MTPSPFLNILWWAEIALQILVVLLGLRSKTCRRWSSFLFYVGYLAGWNLLSRAAMHSYSAYFYVYWIGSFFEQLILVAVILDLAKPLFSPWWIVPVEVSKIFHWTLGILLAIALLLPLVSYSTLANFGADWYLMAVARTLQRSVTLFIAGTAAAGVCLARYLGIPWLHKPSLFVAGLLAKFGLELAVWFAVLSSGSAETMTWQWVYEAARILACAFWVGGVLVKEKRSIELNAEAVKALRRFSAHILELAGEPAWATQR
jgi:hypothetical protein